MRDYQKEYFDYPVKCIVCGEAWIRDARHVKDGQIEDCKPDNLRFLEWKYEESLREIQITRMIREIIVGLVDTLIGCMYRLGIGLVEESQEIILMICIPMKFALAKNTYLKII
jgi:hypothetical protein